jgi:transposase InsO family protein
MDVREQRVQFVVAASRAEKSFSRLCEEFEISRPTGYLWKKRYQQEGVSGLVEHSRRRASQAHKLSEQVERQVEQVRLKYPDWGARKLQQVLSQQGVKLSRGGIHRALLRCGLVQKQQGSRRSWQRFEREQPNQLWQMDFKGPKSWPQANAPLSVLDDYSRYLIVLQTGRDMTGETVREQLEGAFEQCGVPDGMLMDHGSPWWGQQSPCGLTVFSLWLMRQGIRVYYSGVAHPQTQGKVERHHGSLQRAVVLRQAPSDQLQSWLDDYRWEYNHVRPHQALKMKTPASLWSPSKRRYDPNPTPWEYAEGAWVRKLDHEGSLDIQGKKWHISAALRRERIQLVAVEQRLMVYYCSTLIRELDLTTQRSTIVGRWIKNSGKEEKTAAKAALENASRFPLSPPTAAAEVVE